MSPFNTDALRTSFRRPAQIATLVAALIASSCRFGGPTGDPTLPVGDGSAGSAGSGQAGTAGSGGQAGGAGSGGQGGAVGSGGSAGDAGSTSTGGSGGGAADVNDDIADNAAPDVERDGEADGLDGRADAAGPPDGGLPDSASDGAPPACVPPFTSAVCDPVCNVGCTALFRCDIADTPRTGVCVGTLLSTVPEGMACTRTAVTDDCLERLSCLEGICRRLCYRDTDCTTSGTCCNTAIDVDAGPSGYRFCAPCAP
jgi:hypothetical protein